MRTAATTPSMEELAIMDVVVLVAEGDMDDYEDDDEESDGDE